MFIMRNIFAPHPRYGLSESEYRYIEMAACAEHEGDSEHAEQYRMLGGYGGLGEKPKDD